ncbi:Na-translocating system protein MpsC family protein [Bacillus sp. USDA818B3_A]|uniref:Na-translocating system protein MpsC family protein n=1 Tax=Bacillus sp. USDA818B3_A TaxID=2698834 RepID=UPI0013710826|nr:Na-translocating system protein MpsC family protein [Bacillus sp. USDA818B3_A]
MSSPVQQKLMDISSLTSKLLRKNFGRGPESCYAYANGRYLVFYIRGFMSPMESVLIDHGNADNVDISRNIVMKTVLDQLKGIIELEFERDIESFYHDWNYPQNTGMIAIQFEADVIKSGDQDSSDSIALRTLIDEVDRISILVQKKPDKTDAFYISPKMYLVKREGILIQIEKALILKGYEQTLLVTKDELEKSYLHRDGRFEEIFRNPVADIFVDWDFNEDRSIICFVLK